MIFPDFDKLPESLRANPNDSEDEKLVRIVALAKYLMKEGFCEGFTPIDLRPNENPPEPKEWT